LRCRRIKPNPSKPEASNASEAGSGAAEIFVITGVIVPVKLPALSNVSPVIKAVVFRGSSPRLGSIPSTSNSLTPPGPKSNTVSAASIVSKTKAEPFHKYRSYGFGLPISGNTTLAKFGFPAPVW